MLDIDKIRIDGGTQARVALNPDTVADYADAYRAGANMPAIVVFYDGSHYWLADGFHRFFGAKEAGKTTIFEEVRPGTQREAVLYSLGANARHGLQRTKEDKRRAVMTLLNDPEWSAWSDREIARQCSVSDRFVNGIRSSLETASSDNPAASANGSQIDVRKSIINPINDSQVRTVERNGTTYQQNTANIGKPQTMLKPAGALAPASPPSKAVKQDPPVAAEVSHDELGELRCTVAEQSRHIAELQASLKETLADNEMMGRVFDADDKIKASMDEARRQKAIAESAERTLAAKNGEYMARAKQLTHWKNRAEKAEKALAKASA